MEVVRLGSINVPPPQASVSIARNVLRWCTDGQSRLPAHHLQLLAMAVACGWRCTVIVAEEGRAVLACGLGLNATADRCCPSSRSAAPPPTCSPMSAQAQQQSLHQP